MTRAPRAQTLPDDVPVPQASIEFEVPDVSAAAEELRAKGYRLPHGSPGCRS